MPAGELISLDEALTRYEPEWRELAVRRGNAFVTPEWVRSWAQVLGDPGDVRVATVRDRREALLGLVPFEIAGGTARIAGGSYADHLHPVAAAEDESAVGEAAIAAVAKEGGWSTLVLANVDSDAAWARAELAGLGGGVMRRRQRSQSVLPYAELAPSYDEYLAGRSGNFRRQLRRFDRRLAEAASLELRQTREQGELAADMDTFFRLHYGRWERQGGSTLETPLARAFHESFAAAALAAGWLRLLVLEADGKAIAAFYGWRVGDRYAFYQAGFDPEWSEFSVGLVLHGRVVAAAIAEGAREYDMLLGDEAYKFRFCGSVRHVTTSVLTRPWSRAGAAVALELAARRAAGRLPDGVKSRASGLERLLPTSRRRQPGSGR